jgi:preprotein translocase subunit YajC
VMLIGMLVLMFGMTWWSNKKQTKAREKMMAEIRKGDKVMMSGGMIGTLVDVTDDEVVVRFEEGRIRFTKSALQGVVGANKNASVTEPKETGKTAGV